MPNFDRVCAPLLRILWILLAAGALVSSLPCAAQATPLNRLTVLTSPRATGPERAAAELLVAEANLRTGLHWSLQTMSAERGRVFAAGSREPQAACVILARVRQIPGLLPRSLRARWRAAAPSAAAAARAEGFTVASFADGPRTVIVIAGDDSRGVLFGAGYLLRHLSLNPGSATLPGPLRVHDAPEKSTRSHQIGYRFKNNTYDAWTLPMFEQQVRDLAVFGISGLQLIAPESDDRATSPLYPAPALPTLIGLGRQLAKYGLDCDLYYPEMQADYTQPAAISSELAKFTALVRAMPRVNALYVPGGDPGHTSPEVLLPLVARQAAVLRHVHPGATVWVSAQGFDEADFASFYRYLRTTRPRWLTGVFFGPQSRDSLAVERAQIPRRYRILFYPDIAHTMHAQFPVPQWDPVFAMTEGREPIDPRPVDETQIYRHFAALHSGFVTYSEGVNDDVNKFLWTRLGWHRDTDPHETLREYARYFLGGEIGGQRAGQSSDAFADALFALEQNWRGPPAANPAIARTEQHLEALEQAGSPAQRTNWRLESALYRGAYDAFLQAQLRIDQRAQANALAELAQASQIGSLRAMDAANEALQPKPLDPATEAAAALRTRVYALAGRLWAHARLQLSVQLYGASSVDRGANLDRVDVPLNDRVWLMRRFAAVRALPTEPARLLALRDLQDAGSMPAGTFYDDLGQPEAEPHLDRGMGFVRDPEFYRTAIDGIADATTAEGWRLADLSYAETLYETPLHLHYEGLRPATRYTLRVTYAGEAYTLPMTLRDGAGELIHGPRMRLGNPETVEFALPDGAVSNGKLDLFWSRPKGLGGGGRGNQVARVWLIPQGATP